MEKNIQHYKLYIKSDKNFKMLTVHNNGYIDVDILKNYIKDDLINSFCDYNIMISQTIYNDYMLFVIKSKDREMAKIISNAIVDLHEDKGIINKKNKVILNEIYTAEETVDLNRF